MKIRLLEFSIVVVASDCNPTILNPDFLERQEIVPAEWEWKVSGPAITTPPFATVSYNSGVNLFVEPNKFQVTDTLTEMPDTSKIPAIASKYIQALPHVRYTAVGHNFRGFAEHSEPEVFLKRRFLKDGTWNSKKHSLKGTSLKFAYSLPDGQLHLTMDGTTIKELSDAPKELRGILVQANYHRDCVGYPSNKQVIEHFTHIKSDWDHFQVIISDILGDNHV